MKKKAAMIGVGAAVGSILLVSSVYGAMDGASGYKTYKSALLNTAAVTSVTEKAGLSIEDNGKVLLQVNATTKSDNATHTGSADIAVKSGSAEQGIQVFYQDDKAVLKSDLSETYQFVESDKSERGPKKNRKNQPDPNMSQEMETIMDALLGNLKDYVTVNESGATKEVAMHLTATQIPASVNAIGSLIIKTSGQDHSDTVKLSPEETLGIPVNDIIKSLPKLTSDIKIDAVNLDAKVNADNQLSNQSALIQISGKDSQGTNKINPFRLPIFT